MSGKISTLIFGVGSLALAGTASQAQSIMEGYVGLSYSGHSFVTSGDVTESDTGSSYGLEGAFALNVASGLSLVLDGSYEDISANGGGIIASDVPYTYTVGAHLLYDIAPGYKIGGLVGYGFGESKNGSPESYDVLFYGIEGQADFGSGFFGYAQIAAGDVQTANGGSNGFINGYMLRGGLGYAYSASSTFTLDFEYAAETTGFEDDGENGTFYRVKLGGEYLLSSYPIAITYFVGYDYYETLGDQILEDTFYGIGARYYFGGGNRKSAFDAGIVGSPTIVSHASGWMELFD